jgi:hypothetical protein
VDRRIHAEPVGHAQRDRVALAPAQQRPRHAAVDGDGIGRAAGVVDRDGADR